jgi:uncharacterized membrane protein YphA (DoxX/SURF4 family)
MKIHDLPARVATGAFIAHSGWEKWNGSAETAQGVHSLAAGAFPVFEKIEPRTFLKAVAVAEMGIGVALLTPLVSNRLAGAALTAFAGALVAMYLRTPAMHREGSVWPTPNGIGVSKDAWMLGIGLGLVTEKAA